MLRGALLFLALVLAAQGVTILMHDNGSSDTPVPMHLEAWPEEGLAAAASKVVEVKKHGHVSQLSMSQRGICSPPLPISRVMWLLIECSVRMELKQQALMTCRMERDSTWLHLDLSSCGPLSQLVMCNRCLPSCSLLLPMLRNPFFWRA